MDTPLRVLVVEESGSAREASALALCRAGYDVMTAGDGAAALALLRAGAAPDLLVLGLLLPLLDSWRLLERLRAEGPAVPVLVATGAALTRAWADDYGCAGSLRKPFAPEALVAEVRRCLGAARPGRREVDTAALQGRPPRFGPPPGAGGRGGAVGPQAALARGCDREGPGGRADDRGAPACLHERVAAVAYWLWQQEGRPHGRDKEHWHAAVERLGAPGEAGQVAR